MVHLHILLVFTKCPTAFKLFGPSGFLKRVPALSAYEESRSTRFPTPPASPSCSSSSTVPGIPIPRRPLLRLPPQLQTAVGSPELPVAYKLHSVAPLPFTALGPVSQSSGPQNQGGLNSHQREDRAEVNTCVRGHLVLRKTSMHVSSQTAYFQLTWPATLKRRFLPQVSFGNETLGLTLFQNLPTDWRFY